LTAAVWCGINIYAMEIVQTTYLSEWPFNGLQDLAAAAVFRQLAAELALIRDLAARCTDN
jgi:hypothetical protein